MNKKLIGFLLSTMLCVGSVRSESHQEEIILLDGAVLTKHAYYSVFFCPVPVGSERDSISLWRAAKDSKFVYLSAKFSKSGTATDDGRSDFIRQCRAHGLDVQDGLVPGKLCVLDQWEEECFPPRTKVLLGYQSDPNNSLAADQTAFKKWAKEQK
jgi:hypothetical protein